MGTTLGVMSAYVELARPQQWYKNLLLFAGLVFAKELGNLDFILTAAAGFAAFCALSAAVYSLNDVADRYRDKQHTRKMNRPIPSGRVSVRGAVIFAVLLLGGGIVLSALIGWVFLLVALAYLVEAFSYSIYLRNVVIIDALTLATGFVIRAYAGTVAVDVPITPWLAISVFLLALFLTFGKRRHELAVLGEAAENHRQILKHYTVHMIEDMMAVSTATLIMAYSIYTFVGTTRYMMFTIPFAVYGLLRYMLLAHTVNEGGEPEHIFKDLPSLANIVLWAVAVVIILYFAPESTPILG